MDNDRKDDIMTDHEQTKTIRRTQRQEEADAEAARQRDNEPVDLDLWDNVNDLTQGEGWTG